VIGRQGGTLLVGRLLRRQLWADRGVVALLALVVAAGAFLAAAVTRSVDDVSTRALRGAVVDAGPLDRGISGAVIGAPLAGSPTDPYGDLTADVRDGPAASLARWALPPQWDLYTPEFWVTGPIPRPGPGRHFVLRAGSAWPGAVRFVEGRPPRTATAPPETLRAARAADAGDLSLLPAAPPVTVEIALSTSAAELLSLRTGDELVVGLLNGAGLPELRLVLTGLFEPRDPAAELWQVDPSALRPLPGLSDREGTFRIASAYFADGALPVLSQVIVGQSATTTLTVRVDVDAGRLLPEDVAALATGVRRATTQTVLFRDGGIGFTSGLPEALARYQARRGPVVALAAVLLAGLLGCAGVVLFLAARLLLERRRAALALAVTRGAAPSQGLAVLALEALVVALPAAAAGALLAGALVPGRLRTTGLLLVVAAAVLPVVVVPIAGWRQVAPRRVARSATTPGRWFGARRTASGGTSPGVLRHGRRAGEVFLLGVTAAAVAAIVSRGVAAAGTGAGAGQEVTAAGTPVDPLVAATPLLVAVSAALLAHRALAVPLGAAIRWAAGRPGLVGFLGLARAGRAGALGVSATAALTVALAGATLSSVTQATLDAGAERAAWRAVGADLRLTSGGLGDAQAAALARVPGVEAATPVTLEREVPFFVIRPGGANSLSPDALVTVIAVDPAELADVQRDVPHRPALPPGFAAPTAKGGDGLDVLPVVVSSDLGRAGDDVRFEIGARQARGKALAALDEFPGAPPDGPWLLVGADPLRRATGAVLSSQVLLARAPGLAGDAAPSRAFLDQVRRAAGAGTVTTPAAWRGGDTGSTLVRAVRTGVPVSVAAGGLLAALAVFLTLLGGGAARRRFLAHLRALGLSGRQAGTLVALEVLPGAVVALAAGLVAGLATAWLVLPAADLRPLTGAVAEPPVVVPVGTVAAVAAGFAAVLLAGVLLAALEQRRVSPAAAARLGDAE
jgi:putative ABC transport system permease protein